MSDPHNTSLPRSAAKGRELGCFGFASKIDLLDKFQGNKSIIIHVEHSKYSNTIIKRLKMCFERSILGVTGSISVHFSPFQCLVAPQWQWHPSDHAKLEVHQFETTYPICVIRVTHTHVDVMRKNFVMCSLLSSFDH